MWYQLYKIIYNILLLINDILTDLRSIRNFLIALTYILCLIVVYRHTDPVIVSSVIACFTIILNSYFSNRQRTQELEMAQEQAAPDTAKEQTQTAAPVSSNIFVSIWNTIKGLFK